MKRLRQIVTKAVVAKGKKRFESKEYLKPPNSPNSILGCWVINHQYNAKKVGKMVEIQGKFDINIWYSYNQQSKTGVHTESFTYKDRIKLHYRDEEVTDLGDVRVKVLQHPNCVEATITKNDEQFEVVVEREFLVECIGETVVCISVHPNDFEEEWSFDESSSSSSSSSSGSESGKHHHSLDDSSSFGGSSSL